LRDSTAFEQQIHRIHELLEGSGAEVIWNDHIPDPDNPSQRRQVDVSIRRDGKLTLVECRDHESPQDVTWIEELIGRRSSLKADTIIAVSSSAFTAGALLKAKAFGIILRDMRDLTDLEIKAWGGQIGLTLYFYEYSDLEVDLCFERESLPKLQTDAIRSEFASYAGVQSLFNAAAQQIGAWNLMSGEHVGQAVRFNIRLELAGFRLSGEAVIQVAFCGKARLVATQVMSKAVLAYGEPADQSGQPQAVIEQFWAGRTSIVHEARRISILLDLSEEEVPPLWQFRFFKATGGNEDMEHEVLEIVGLDKLKVNWRKLNVNICPM
jgi:hypothetical protein